MQQVQVPINSLPLILVCLSNGLLAIVRYRPGIIFDHHTEEWAVNAAIFEDSMILTDENNNTVEVRYNTLYNHKTFPMLRKWLQQQKLAMPVLNEGGT